MVDKTSKRRRAPQKKRSPQQPSDISQVEQDLQALKKLNHMQLELIHNLEKVVRRLKSQNKSAS